MRRGLYLTLRLVSRYGRLIRRRFTRPGLLALAALLASAVVGVDTNQTVAYQLFAILFVLVLFGMIEAWFFRSNIRVKRILPQFATAGDSFEYRVSIRNESAKTETGLALLENTVDPRPAYEVFLAGLRRKRHDVTGLRRYSVWDKWQGMIAANQPARLTEQPLPDLPAHRDIEIRPRVTTEGRGSVDFTGVTIARADRFGLFKAFAVTRQPDSLLVLPKRYPLPRLSLPGARIYQHGGMTMASSVGDSEEFLGLRDYRPGDPLKQIHWKSFARVGYPIVKEHQDEFFERHALVLDTFSEGGRTVGSKKRFRWPLLLPPLSIPRSVCSTCCFSAPRLTALPPVAGSCIPKTCWRYSPTPDPARTVSSRSWLTVSSREDRG